jgi:hypothetical protein
MANSAALLLIILTALSQDVGHPSFPFISSLGMMNERNMKPSSTKQASQGVTENVEGGKNQPWRRSCQISLSRTKREEQHVATRSSGIIKQIKQP